MNPVKVGLIGYGLSGRVFHAPFLKKLPEFQVTQVFSSREKEVRFDFPDASKTKLAASVDDLLKSDVDLVVITSPNTEHYSQAKAALQLGKHVLLEKPFVAKLSEAEELMALAEQKKKVLSVFHNRRFDGDFIWMKEALRGGRFGDWTFFESRFDRFRPLLPAVEQRRWRDQPLSMSGVFWDLGPHLIDQAICLLGFPKDIQLRLLFQRAGATVDDGFILHLGYGNQSHGTSKLAVLSAGSVVAFPEFRMRLDAAKGGAQIIGMDGQEESLRTGQGQAIRQKLRTFDGDSNQESDIPVGDYTQFYQGIAEAILYGKDAPVTAQEAADVVQIMELAIRSHHLGQRLPVRSL
ncbi:MAG: Gfo/Idh/MocA family oxidoreductase [Bdellovibrionales bacterium]|nr:Gfo/Idh/MocA family oxidoreductase [Bdellovibrionales bacterium]